MTCGLLTPSYNWTTLRSSNWGLRCSYHWCTHPCDNDEWSKFIDASYRPMNWVDCEVSPESSLHSKKEHHKNTSNHNHSPGRTYNPKGQANHTHIIHQTSWIPLSAIGPFVSASKFVRRQKKGRIFFIFRESSNKRYARRGRCQSHESMHQKDNHPLATSPFQHTHNSGTRKITPGTKDHHSTATRPSTPQDTNQVSDPSNQLRIKAHVGDPEL